jgi:hypothetical protein
MSKIPEEIIELIRKVHSLDKMETVRIILTIQNNEIKRLVDVVNLLTKRVEKLEQESEDQKLK